MHKKTEQQQSKTKSLPKQNKNPTPTLHNKTLFHKYGLIIQTRYRLPNVSKLRGCFLQWKIILMFLFKSNVFRPSGAENLI